MPSDRSGSGRPAASRTPCSHKPRCPGAEEADRESACTVASFPEQGWSLLCNGVVVFDDTGELLPDGRVVPPRRPTDMLGLG
ncbi:DUF5999 family protein [Catenulispora subtropica]|uniref:DUF5999 family protein n=1 Tax=Catenulispora subtropica TaxID=450798 RepID=UPI0031D64A9D